MDRKRPPPSACIPSHRSSSTSSSQPTTINTVHDMPPELREMLASNIRESRANNSSGSGSKQGTTSETPKRKKPLTRRVVGAAATSTGSSPAAVVNAPVRGGLNNGGGGGGGGGGGRTLSSATSRGQLLEERVGSKESAKSIASPAKAPITTIPAPTQKPSTPAQESESEYDDDDDEFGDDDEIEWETVDLSTLKKNTPKPAPTSSEPLILTLTMPSEPSKSKSSTSKKPPTPAERKIRLEIHKLHLLCLISHLHLRSTFCNDPKSQSSLLPILEKRIISELNDTSFQQSKIFKQGLSNAAAAFKRRYKITKPGARKALWGYTPPSFDSMWGDIPMGIDEFRSSAKKLSGSRDLGTQLFCTLLRRLGLDARIVCSLQPLSWQFKAKYCIDDAKRENMKFLEEDRDDYQTSDEDVDTATFVGSPNKTFGGAGPMRANFRIAPPVAPARTGAVVGPPKGKKKTTKRVQIHDPALPTYWVEVFDVINQSWITIDPLGAGIIRSLTNLEPPQWDWENEMSYVIAFDNDNYVRDITRKYVKTYNSYTRSLRVEATLDGEKWWKKALKLYRLPAFLAPDRDQFEDGLMNDRLLREGIPKSLAAMKNHPVFAIEEQLRQNEVVHPKNQCGTMTGKNKRPIPVYRRQDVKQVKSATQWYMLGREIKAGEQPLKHKKARKARRAPDPDDMDLDEMEDMDGMDTGMYAHFQTIMYQPEPCIGPIVPKNAYGNIDLYVPSMLPEGGVHIPHKLARVAADFLGLGGFVADAVTGFDFRNGGKSTPVINGIVAGVECEEGIWEMIEYIEKEQEEEADEVRRLTALNLWRKFLVGLRIKERVDEYAMDGEEAVVEEEEEEEDSYQSQTIDPAESGGFIVEQHENMTSVADSNVGSVGFFTDDIEDMAGDLMRDSAKLAREKEERRLLDEARARRSRLTEIELQKVETGEYYDPDAFEGGGGFFAEDTVVEEPNVDKGKGRALDSEIFTGGGGGGFLPEEATGIEERGTEKDTDMESFGGGFLVEESEPNPISTANTGKRKRDSREDLGGGFMVDEADVDTKTQQNDKQSPQSLLTEKEEDEEIQGDKSMEENLDDDDIGDDFEYEDAGWTSD
ncbi:hypothetical protein TWF506_001270 [Arthrobotrys conoides]|uniref:Rad4-domain-containing protein n=1 Tax=Arthrobotrys conoides TaxID=74498 RepID=A0AAN8PRS0_9PEZI